MGRDHADPRETLTVDVGKRWPDGTTIDAAFELPASPASVTVLFGPSGAGKTTLLRLIAGLEPPTRGGIRYGNQVWSDSSSSRSMPPQLRDIGYLVQDYALFPHLSVGRNIGYGLADIAPDLRKDRVGRIAGRLGLEGLLARRPGELSGGQQQRVALARALARRPRFVMLDEPFAALDSGTRDQVRAWLGEILREMDLPAIFVTHDWVDALTIGDRMVVIDDGRMLQEGTPREVLTRPANAEVAAIVGMETVVAAEGERRDGDIVRLRAGQAQLTAVDPAGGSDSFWACIRGEDVTLESGRGAESSARNRLSGRVVEVSPRGALTRVGVDVGFPLVSLVTRPAAIDLDLRVGMPVTAVFKASIVHLVPRNQA